MVNDEDDLTEPGSTEDLGAREHLPSAQREIGPYRLLQKLGEGGMGTVFLADQLEPIRRRVALKLIKAGWDSRDIVARFETERQALALMDHPSIARVYDAGQTPTGRPYFTMEYVKGVPITEYCDTHHLSNRDRIKLMILVCRAVQHAHQRAIIHRDLKPSNILVTTHESKPVPKIIDFGVAKAVGQRLTDQTMFTQVGQMIGTLEYMSPEQADLTGEDVDTRTDVYALGIILYELLVGALPFDTKTLRRAGFDEIRRHIREEDPPRPSTRLTTLGETSTSSARNRKVELGQLLRDLRGDLDWITLKTLEKDRTRRYGTPEELAADLLRFLNDEPVVASPPSVIYRARKFVRRHRIGVAFASLVLLSLAALTATMIIQAGRVARERDRANVEAQTANAALEFMSELFESSTPGEARGNTVTAREILDRGLEKLGELESQPEVQARLMGTIGRAYWDLGLYDAATDPLQTALEINRRALGRVHPEVAEALVRLGLLLRKRADFQGAEKVFREELGIQRELHEGDHLDIADAMSRVADALGNQGMYAAALPLQEDALAMAKRLLEPGDTQLSDFLRARANLHGDMGESKSAIPLYIDALELDRKHFGEDHPEVAFSLDNLAIAYDAAGEDEKAEVLYRESLAVLRKVYGESHPELAQTLGNIGGFLIEKEDYQAAEEMLQEAIGLNRDLVGPDHPFVGDNLSGLAEIKLAADELEEAEKLIREAIRIQRLNFAPGHPKVTFVESIYGDILVQMGRTEEAEPLFLAYFESLGTQNPDPDDRLWIIERLVEFYEEWGKPEEAARFRALLNAEPADDGL